MIKTSSKTKNSKTNKLNKLEATNHTSAPEQMFKRLLELIFPLAKVFIGLGMKLFGDSPFGWRIMSLIFGSLSLVAMYFWGLALFKSISSALFLVFISLMNQLLFVFSRTAMLDPFMFCFMATGFALISSSIAIPKKNDSPNTLLIGLGGLALGLASACKWFGMIGIIPCNQIGQSPWFTWPILTCPVWLQLPALDTDPETGRKVAHGIAFLGNPAVLWGGLLALLVCLIAWKQTRSPEAEIILCFYPNMKFHA